MNLANMPDANAIQQCNAAPVTSHEGIPESCKSGESSFAAIVNKEINNNEVNNGAENSGIVLSSDVQAANGLKNESGKSEKDPGPNVQDKKGLKVDNILLNMLGSAAAANTNGLQVSVINEIEDPAITEDTLQQLINQRDQSMPAEKGLPAALINRIKDQKVTEEALQQLKDQQDQNMSAEKGLLAVLIDQIKDQKITEEALQQSENQQDQNVPSEKGLKTGALLYAFMNSAVNSTDGPGADEAQDNNDIMTKGAAVAVEKKGHPERGLKAGTFLNDPNNDNKASKNAAKGKENLLGDLAQNVNSKISSDSGKASVVEKLLEHAGKNNKNGLNHLKSARVQQTLTGPGLTGNNNNSKNIQSGLPPEVAKEINKAEGLKNYPDNAIKTVKGEAASDNSNPLNHSSIKLESGKPAEAIFSVNASKPLGPNQALDNIVYVIKSSSKMGVSLDHDILGKLDINVSMEKGMLNVHINTSEKIAREFIENNIQYIVDSLAKDGVSVGGFSVGLKNRNDHEGNVFITNNKQESRENQVINEKARASAVSGLVSVFA